MFIYVCGPYSPPPGIADPYSRRRSIENNIKKAQEAAIKIAEKGHFPFVPHTMLCGWEDKSGISREIVMQNCYKWLEKCDALLYLGSSPGADKELKRAKELKMRVYYSIKEITDDGREITHTPPSENKFVAFRL